MTGRDWRPFDWALAEIDRGNLVFPLEEGGKRPAIPSAHPEGDPLRGVCKGECGADGHGLHDATADIGRATEWGRRWRRENWGVRTGLLFDLLDLDSAEAVAALNADMPHADISEDDPVIWGPTIRTPRGWHVRVAATGLGSTVNIGGILGGDWRGVNAYSVAPGSRKADGTGWFPLLPDDPRCGLDAPILPAPDWLLALIERPAHFSPRTGVDLPRDGTADRYGQASLERALGRLACATEGGRNHELNREAHGLGKVVDSGHLRGSDVAIRLLAVATQIGLPEGEAKRTIESGLGVRL